MNSNLIFKWLKDPRFSPGPEEDPDGADDGDLFLPVEITVPAIDHEPEVAGTRCLSKELSGEFMRRL